MTTPGRDVPEPPAAFGIKVVGEPDGARRLMIVGELDLETAPLLDDQLRQADASDAALILVDLDGVSFMDSTGLRTLLAAVARTAPGTDRLRFTEGSAQVRRLLDLAGVLDRLPIDRRATGASPTGRDASRGVGARTPERVSDDEPG